MIYVDNYAEWINPEWVEYLMTHDGTKRPGGGHNPSTDEFRHATEVGYDLSKTYWHHYDHDSCPLIVTPPIDTDKDIMWWFIKMIPGQFMPMHKDPHVTTDNDKSDCIRYWMPLQDYAPGHIFVYGDTVITNYKAGDLWYYSDANKIHGACNIGYTPRLTFQFTTYNKI